MIVHFQEYVTKSRKVFSAQKLELVQIFQLPSASKDKILKLVFCEVKKKVHIRKHKKSIQKKTTENWEQNYLGRINIVKVHFQEYVNKSRMVFSVQNVQCV